MGAQYYLYVDQQYGPYNLESIQAYVREGRVIAESWMHCEGETRDWTRAVEVASLKILFQKSNAASPVVASQGLASRLKKASESHPEGQQGEGTMLVAPSSAAGVRMMPTVLPSAPLSDIAGAKAPATSISAPVSTAEPKALKQSMFITLVSKFKNLFKRKK